MASRRQEPEPEERRVRASGGIPPQVFALTLVVVFGAAAAAAYMLFGAGSAGAEASEGGANGGAEVREEVDPFAGLPPEEPPAPRPRND